MTGKTHRVGGVLCVLGGYLLLEKNNLLLQGVSPLIQLTIMYPFGVVGSTMSDQDQNWDSVPNKDILGFGIHKVLHLTTGIREGMNENSLAYKLLGLFDARHRSWQTHSDWFLMAMIGSLMFLYNSANRGIDNTLLSLVLTGLILGLISHLVLDMITPEGVWSLTAVIIGAFLQKVFKVNPLYFLRKVHFVPNISFFRTGGVWETIIRWVMWLASLCLFGKILYQILQNNL